MGRIIDRFYRVEERLDDATLRVTRGCSMPDVVFTVCLPITSEQWARHAAGHLPIREALPDCSGAQCDFLSARTPTLDQWRTAIGAKDEQTYPHDHVRETTKGPSTPAAHWRVAGEEDPHVGRYDRGRAALAGGDLTDDEVANRVFIYPSIANLTIAKDRIRWLSRQLVAATAEVEAGRSSGGQPGPAPLPDPDAPACSRAGVSAPSGRPVETSARGTKPETAHV